MAIDLLNRISEQLQKVHTETNTNSASGVSDAEAAKVLRAVYALKPGDALQGELLSINGNDISLLLGNAVTLNAKMDKNLMLQTGQMMNFLVSGNQNGKLSLQPLFTNTGLEQNAMKALDAANIPVTDKAVSLAEEMMKQGLPVNKESLQMMFRSMNGFPDADIMDLVMLQKMNIPVTKENISMMHLYQTNQQVLFDDLQGFSGELSRFALTSLQSMDGAEVQKFLQEFISVFRGESQESEGEQLTGAAEQPSSSIVESEQEQPVIKAGDSMKQSMTEEMIHTGEKETAVLKEQVSVKNSVDGSEEAEKLLHDLERLFLHKGSGKEGIQKELSGILYSLLKDRFLMKPEEVSNPDYVKEFYKSLLGKMDQLDHLLKSSGRSETALAKNVTAVKDNIQFMNQINEMYHYVQLPLKMNQEAASGDLYVYKRKHARTGDDGALTALLHLSMPHLGNMDVFLSLKEERLSTRFCMEKEELIDFMEAHMHTLNERLAKKGYHLTATVAAAEKEEQTVIDRIMKNECKIPLNSDTSFDCRC